MRTVFLLLLPAVLVILGIVVSLGIVGIVVLVSGVGDSNDSKVAMKNKLTKRVSLLFFISLCLLGLSCASVIVGIILGILSFIAPTLILVGLVVAVLGVIGIIKALGPEKKAARTSLVVLLALSTFLGASALVIGCFCIGFI